MNRKGFTLVELLATILIIGLVLGLTAYGIISSVNSAKATGTTLSLSGVKEAARTYSNEAEENRWKKSNINNYTYFCVTTEELINKGLLDKKASKIENGDIKLNDYIVVIKDYTTKVIKREEVLNTSKLDEITKDAYGYCTGSIKPENIIKDVSLKDSTSKTDKIEVNYIDAEFKTDNEVNKINEVSCLYGNNTQVIEESTGVTIDKTNKKCKITGLKQNTPYYVQVCMTSENGSKSCSTPESVNTKTIKKPNININNNNSIKITYDETNITAGEASYYFKSNVKGESVQSVLSCTLNEGIYTCSNSTTSISENTWYRTTNKEVVLTYKDSGNITVTAETRDKSNNYKQSSKDFSLYKIIFTFNKDTADTIGGQSNNIEKLCIADKGKSCSITSPSIEKSGYNIIGWNTNKEVKESSWGVNVTKNINSNATYYPITEQIIYTINYDANDGSNAPNSQKKEYNKNITLSEKVPTREGYTFTNWNSNKDGTGITYTKGATYSSNSSVTLYAQWRENKVYIKLNVNGGEVTAETPKGGTYTTDSSGIISKNGNNIFHEINYGSNMGKNGLANYNNKNYLYITKTDSIGVKNQEWKCLSDNCRELTYDQAVQYNSNNFCDASNGDCTVVLGVNWEKYKKIDNYRCTYDSNNSVKDYYWITECRGNRCYYTRKNCNYEATGSLIWNSIGNEIGEVKDCKEEQINGDRCVGNDTYHITTCIGGICNYDKINGKEKNGIINNRCTLSKDCGIATKIMYVTPSNGVNCRAGSSTDYRVVTAYACGVGIKVKTTPENGWYYSVNDDCYSSGEYLSENIPTNCGTSTGGGTTTTSSGFLSKCYCNTNEDCGISGTKINVWCDKNQKNTGSKKNEYKYMCAWKNASSFGGFSNSTVNYCLW